LCIGGASIGVFVLYGLTDIDILSAQALATFSFLNVVINYPHFLASYKLLYGSGRMVRRYRGAAVWVPLLLGLYAVAAVATYSRSGYGIRLLNLAAAALLAWHYTGQAWGMMAVFAHLRGARFADRERRLIRANLYALLAFHVAWVGQVEFSTDPTQGLFAPIRLAVLLAYPWISLVAAASCLLGVAGLLLAWRRIGRAPSVQTLIPYLAIHLWYVFLYRDPAALFWVQLAHALQYLIFPLRVEVNRQAQQPPAQAGTGPVLLKTYGWTLLLGALAFIALPRLSSAGLASLFGGAWPCAAAIFGFINIHHYVIDNRIWRLREREVRQALFLHLKQ
jgi:hypothetical protein